MGKTIERIAQTRSHNIVHIHDGGPMDLEALKAADVAIEFTQPEAAAENIAALLTHGTPVVSGTTGWLEHKASVDALAEKHEVGFLYASNFSLGVNLFFVMNDCLLTPSLGSGILPGTTRALILDIAARAGIDCKEAVCDMETLQHARSVFATLTTFGMIHIDRIQGQRFVLHPLEQTIYKAYLKQLNEKS